MNPSVIRHCRILLAGRTGLLLLFLLALPLVLGAWKEVTGRRINPRYVERIKDGQTKKHEILVLFGDPHEIDRTPEGLVFTYKNYRAAEPRPTREIYKLPEPQSTTPYFMEQQQREEEKKKAAQKAPTREVSSTLTIRFKPDGETVQSHEYKEF